MAKKKFKFDDLSLHFDDSDLMKRLKKLSKSTPKYFRRSLEKAGIQFLTWATTGSPNSPSKPPIEWGVLRGSGAVYVGGKLVGQQPTQIEPGAPEGTAPATTPESISAPENRVTWSWNTPYAARQHEGNFEPGEVTARDPNAGRKWLENHLEADWEDFWTLVADETQKEFEKLLEGSPQ